MSEETKWVPKEKLVYECPGGEQNPWSSDISQATRALISIANYLAILADETDDITPITHAAFIIGDAMCQAADGKTSEVNDLKWRGRAS